MSAPPTRVLEPKSTLSRLDSAACRTSVRRMSTCRDANTVRAVLNRVIMTDEASAIIEPNLVIINSDSRSKVEAIKELAELIATTDRATDAQELENAVWAREETYSTGLGFGFAIPHCKSDAVHVPTIAVLRLHEPI